MKCVNLRLFGWSKNKRELSALASELGFHSEIPGKFQVRSHYTGTTLLAQKESEEWRGEDDQREFVAAVYRVLVPKKNDITLIVTNF